MKNQKAVSLAVFFLLGAISTLSQTPNGQPVKVLEGSGYYPNRNVPVITTYQEYRRYSDAAWALYKLRARQAEADCAEQIYKLNADMTLSPMERREKSLQAREKKVSLIESAWAVFKAEDAAALAALNAHHSQ